MQNPFFLRILSKGIAVATSFGILAVFEGCNERALPSDTGSNGRDRYTFIQTKSGGDLQAGDFAEITWEFSGHADNYTQLELWHDSTRICFIGSIQAAADSYTWLVPGGLETGHYRIRLYSLEDTESIAYSSTLSIKALEQDIYEPDMGPHAVRLISTDGRYEKHNLNPHDTDWIRFDASPGKSFIISLVSNVQMHLEVIDTAGLTESNLSATQPNYKEQIVFNPKYSGSHYLRVSPILSNNTDSLGIYGNYQVAVNAYESLDGPCKVEFVTPTSQTVWASNTRPQISWLDDTSCLGQKVILDLYRDTTFVWNLSLGAYATNGKGSEVFSLGLHLYSGNRYRIRMTNFHSLYRKSPLPFAYGPYFKIDGIDPDSYEPDNFREIARAIFVGLPQEHNLATGDTDWVSFEGKADQVYLSTAQGYGNRMRFDLIDQNGSTLATTEASNDSLRFTLTKDGKYFFRAFSRYGVGDDLPRSYTLTLDKLEVIP